MNERTLHTDSLASSDVLSENRVNVSEEKSERVIWYKVGIIRPAYRMLNWPSHCQERFLTDDEIVEHIVVRSDSTAIPQRSLLTFVIAGQCEFDLAMGDTSACARVVHSSAVPSLSTERLHPPRPRAPKLSIPQSRLAQILLPHQHLARALSTRTRKAAVSIATSTQRVAPLRHGLGNDAHRRTVFTDDAHLSAPAHAAQRGRVTAVSEHRAREARPACATAPHDLPVHIVATHSRRRGPRLRGAVLKSTSCSEEQHTDGFELIFAQPVPGRLYAATCR